MRSVAGERTRDGQQVSVDRVARLKCVFEPAFGVDWLALDLYATEGLMTHHSRFPDMTNNRLIDSH